MFCHSLLRGKEGGTIVEYDIPLTHNIELTLTPRIFYQRGSLRKFYRTADFAFGNESGKLNFHSPETDF